MLGSRVVLNLDGIYEKSAGKLSIRMAKIANRTSARVIKKR